MTPEIYRRAERLLPPAPTTFTYAKGDFAFQLLQRQVDCGASVRCLKASRYAPLLRQARVRDAISGLGALDQNSCHHARQEGQKHRFPLSWTRWGEAKRPAWDRSWHQMARSGFNLVLQLGVPRDHVRDFRRLCLPQNRDPFNASFHPSRQEGDVTLAWARIDLDFGTREALIEELQSDWVSSAPEVLWNRDNYPAALQRREHYISHVLKPLETLWAEAILSACIDVLLGPLGMKSIALYDYETGTRAKTAKNYPIGPRNLYEQLPKSYCMEKVPHVPTFLQSVFAKGPLRHVFRDRGPEFWHLQARGDMLSPALRRAA